jgi:hypothetical protein
MKCVLNSRGKLGLWLAMLLLASLLTAGCNGTATPTVGEVTSSPIATPGGTIAESPLPTPGPGLPEWNAQPAPGTSNLRGRLVITDQTILLGELLLAKAVPTDNPEVSLLELDEKTAPRAIIDRATGEFVFSNVEPGKYGLIVWEPMSSAPVNDPSTGQTLYVQLTSGEVTDVGTLNLP